MKLRSFAGSPAFWLALQMAAVVIGIHVRGWGTVHEVPDSQSYVQTGFLAPARMLASVRTVGCPLFLRAVAAVSPSLDILPQVHLAFHLLAVVLFCWAMRRFGASAWQAFAASTGILWTIINDPLVHDVASDSLARSLAVVTVALLLAVAATPRLWLWIVLTLSLACTYHVRPAYLFLVALIPCLGPVLRAIHAAWHQQPRQWKRHTAALLAVAVLPLAAFCLVRLAVVGQFGLVSSGGWNMAGLSVELLDRPLIENRVPEDLRPLALEILEAREQVYRQRGLAPAFRDGRIDLEQLRENHEVNLCFVALPAVCRRHPEAADPQGQFACLAVNQDLARLSVSAIGGHKVVYLRFLVRNYLSGLRDIPATNLALSFFAAVAIFLYVVRNLVWPGRSRPVPDPAERSRCYVMQLMIVLGVLFAAIGLLPVAIVQLPLGRYLIAVALFLPSICVLWILQELHEIAAELRSTYGGPK